MFYGDNSAAHTIERNLSTPDAVVFGGFYVKTSELRNLKAMFASAKKSFGLNDYDPVKWNMKDLSGWYADRGKRDFHTELCGKSDDFRAVVFSGLKEIKSLRIVLSYMVSYSDKSKVIKDTFSLIERFSFGSVLQRIGMESQEAKVPFSSIVLDWPPKSQPANYFTEYRWAYYKGKGAPLQQGGEPTTDYRCGPLSDLSFPETIYFTRTPDDSMLQLADMLVGVLKDYLTRIVNGKNPGRIGDLVSQVAPKLRTHYGRICGYGIIFSHESAAIRDFMPEEISRKKAEIESALKTMAHGQAMLSARRL